MEKKKDFIERFSSSITEPAFKDCSFGKDVKEISISIILIKTRPGFEKWDQPRRPRFTELLIGRDGKVLWEKRFGIEIRFDGELFDAFLAADDDEAGKILARESYRALDQLCPVFGLYSFCLTRMALPVSHGGYAPICWAPGDEFAQRRPDVLRQGKSISYTAFSLFPSARCPR